MTKIGLVGCGNISDRYFAGAARSHVVEIAACCDLNPDLARAKAEVHGVRAQSYDDMLRDDEIEIVLNLTVPAAHVDVGLAALAAGKHVYSEKPLGTNIADAGRLLAAAREAGLRIGCAPDTFFGASHQAVREAVDGGLVGRILSGAVCVATHGMEQWHPGPDFFYKAGGGPLLDVGPYYLAQLLNLLGPVRSVVSYGSIGFAERTIETGPRAGETIPVDVPTTVNGALTFASGAVIALTASWDVWKHERNHIELYGEEGTIINPNPVFFNGTPRFSRQNGDWEEIGIDQFPFSVPTRRSLYDGMVADYRMVGLVDMAIAVAEGREHRASGQLALHMLEVLEALETSQGREIALTTSCERPAGIGRGQDEAVLFARRAA